MNTSDEQGVTAQRVVRRRMEWGAAFEAGLLAGAILMLVPRGSPWSSFTFFTPTIIGRAVPDAWNLPLPAVWTLHLGLAIVYGLIISVIISGLPREKAVLVGGILGLAFYAISTGIIAFFWPEWRNPQFPVVFAHLVFGLIVGGAYRGLLPRRIRSESTHL